MALGILLVTCNRPLALIESLNSLSRVFGGSEHFIHIQDNSEFSLDHTILSYFQKKINIQYHKTAFHLSMCANWNDGLERLLTLPNIDEVIVLADRRLVTFNILKAHSILKASGKPFISFDHQNLWVNSTNCLSVLGRPYTYKSDEITADHLTSLVSKIKIDFRAPMLFNCIIKADFLRSLYLRFNSFIGGSDPDMDFLAKFIVYYSSSVSYFDAPCIATNARFVSSSTSSNALNNTRLINTSYAGLSGPRVWPQFADELLTCLIPGAFTPYFLDESIYQFFDHDSLYAHCLGEASFPRSSESYSLIIQQLKLLRTSLNIKSDSFPALDSLHHNPPETQTYPIEWENCITNSANIDLLSRFEIF